MFRPQLLLLVVAAASAASAASVPSNPGLAETVVAVLRGCSEGDAECLGGRAVEAVGRSLAAAFDRYRLSDVQLADNVVLLAEKDAAAAARAPKTLFKGSSPAAIADMVSEFLQSRTLQVRFPKQIIPKNFDEARGKLKKMGGTLLAGLLMMKGTMGALALGALALMAGKALLLSVLSLTLSLIAALKKVSSGHDHRRSGRRADEPEPELIGQATVATDHKSAVAASAHYLAYRNQPYGQAS